MQTYEEVLVQWGGRAGDDPGDLAAMTCRGNHEHSDCSASWTSYDWDGSIVLEEWHRGGLKHREGGPAFITYLTGELFPGHNKTHQELVDEKYLWEAEYYLNGEYQSGTSWG